VALLVISGWKTASQSHLEWTENCLEHSNDVRLIECDPVLDTITHGLEDDTSIASKVLDPFILVAQRSAVLLVKSLRRIPVVQGYERRDARCNQIVDELHVVLKTFLVDGIVAAALGDDARPLAC